MMFVASHKHEDLKGLISQGNPLCFQDVLAEGACVMVPNQSSSKFSSMHVAATTSSSFFMQAPTCNSMSLFNSKVLVSFMLLEPQQVKSGMKSNSHLAV
jgi:hypothetical protein